MKHFTYKLMLAVLFFTAMTFQTATAKHVAKPHLYMFGLAASFNDTIVYFTDVQDVEKAWVETRNGFLLGRDMYSSQLRDYLKTQKQMPQRTCIVFYHKNRSKLEKKFLKMKRLYTQSRDKQQHFDVRFLETREFRFTPVDMSPNEESAQSSATKE
jgi:hypothetical protein